MSFSEGDRDNLWCSNVACVNKLTLDQYRRKGSLCDECEFKRVAFEDWENDFANRLDKRIDP